MQPSLTDVHVNAPLTNLSLLYAQEETAFVADRVFPVLPVSFKSDVYYTFDRSDFNRNQMTKRAPSTESAGGGYKLDNTGTYNCDIWALHKDIDDQLRANSDAATNPDFNATRFLTTQAMISKEVAWASAFFATAIWTTNRSGVASGPVAGTSVLQWNDPASTPIQDVRGVKQSVQLVSGGYRCNKLILARNVFDVLCDHVDFVDRIKYGQTPGRPAQVTLDAMAALFEIDEVLVMDAVQNTGSDSNVSLNAGESNAFIGSKGAMLCYTPSAPGLDTPGCGYNISWTGYLGANGLGGRIKTMRREELNSDRVEIELAYVYKKVSADLGAFFATIIA